MAFVAALEVALAVIISRSARPLLAALFILAILGFYLYTTLRGKFVVWAELFDQLDLQGDERILDLGCGRGCGTAHGRTNICPRAGQWVWTCGEASISRTQWSAEATRRNAIAEGVADRGVELHTADMTALTPGRQQH